MKGEYQLGCTGCILFRACFQLPNTWALVSKANAFNKISLESCLRGWGSCTQICLSEKRQETETLYLVLQGSQLLPCHLCVQEAQEALGCHPRPSCQPARALLCTLQQVRDDNGEDNMAPAGRQQSLGVYRVPPELTSSFPSQSTSRWDPTVSTWLWGT